MFVKDNKLISVSNNDITDGTFVIPDYIEIIDNNAFMECINLHDIIIPNTVLSLGNACFRKCVNLRYVEIKASIENLPDEIFCDCFKLTDIYLSNSIKILGDNSFYNCKSLKYIELPGNLEKIGKGCFYNCISLININLPSSLCCIESESFSTTAIDSIEIPIKITELPFSVFKNCSNLHTIILPNGLKSIGDNAFENCLNLETVNLPNSLIKIGSSVFSHCTNLKHVNIPIKVECINASTFYECRSLQNISILGNIKKIDIFAFDNCINLNFFEFKEGIEYIFNRAFKNCQSLTKILLPPSIKQISENSFNDCNNLKEIVLPSSLTNATDIIHNIRNSDDLKIYIYNTEYTNINLINIRNIRIDEMLDRIYIKLTKSHHIYNLTREKIKEMYNTNCHFKDIVDVMIFNSRLENSNYEKELIKFDNLFPKTRFSNLPSGIIYSNMDNDLISKYNVKMMRHIKSLDIFNSLNLECENVVPNIISFFGLFESDNKCYQRFKMLEQVLSHKYFFNNNDMIYFPNNIHNYFMKVSNQCFVLDKDIIIPSEFKDYLKNIMTYSDVATIKNLKNRFGKLINAFFKNSYTLVNKDIYILKENLSNNEICDINNFILNSPFNNQMTFSNLIEIFTDIPRRYNERILNFFMKNLKTILSKNDYRLKFREIVSRYEEIKNYYLAMGNDDFTYHEAYRYICESAFLNVNKGNHEFAGMVKKSGVTSQNKFNQYQKLYEKIKNKKSSLIPRIKEERKFIIGNREYIILSEMLRKDDPLSLLVGELSYTNCCQRLNDNGYDCLVHAINDGRIFCTYLVDGSQKILLSQSWVWRNGNVICFDNIEGTNFMKKNILYSKLVAETYKTVSKKMIEISIKFKDKIDVIMVGHGHDDLRLLNEYFGQEKKNHIWPSSYYGYLDSSRVHYICGSEELIDTSYIPQQFYFDERIFINETGISITTKTIEKLGKIASKYKHINFVSELSELLAIPIDNLGIIYGEDWYILYKIIDKNLSIIDSGIVELSNKKELIVQEKEILKAYKLFITLYDVSPEIIDVINDKEKIYKK